MHSNSFCKPNFSLPFTPNYRLQPLLCIGNLIKKRQRQPIFFLLHLISGSSSISSEITFSAPPMASTSKFSYQKLIQEGGFDGGDDDDNQIREKVIGRAKSWSRIRNKVHTRRRLRIRIPSLQRFFRRKAKVFMVNWGKVVKRMKESQAHFGDLFAGNYLFMQVTPTPLKNVDRSLKGTYDFHGVSSRYSVPRISH